MSMDSKIPKWLDVRQLTQVLNKKQAAVDIPKQADGKVFVKEQMSRTAAAVPDYTPQTLLDKAFVNRGANALGKLCAKVGMMVMRCRAQNIVRLNKEASRLPSPYLSQIDYVIDYQDMNGLRTTATAAVAFDQRGGMIMPETFFCRGSEVKFDKNEVIRFAGGNVYSPAEIHPQIPVQHQYRPGLERELIHVGSTKFGYGGLRSKLEKRAESLQETLETATNRDLQNSQEYKQLSEMPLEPVAQEQLRDAADSEGRAARDAQETIDLLAQAALDPALQDQLQTQEGLKAEEPLLGEVPSMGEVEIENSEGRPAADLSDIDRMDEPRIMAPSQKVAAAVPICKHCGYPVDDTACQGPTCPDGQHAAKDADEVIGDMLSKDAARSDLGVPIVDTKDHADDVTNKDKGESVSRQSMSDPDYSNVEGGEEAAGVSDFYNGPDEKKQKKEVKNKKKSAVASVVDNYF
jgi:hypothetical protein